MNKQRFLSVRIMPPRGNKRRFCNSAQYLQRTSVRVIDRNVKINKTEVSDVLATLQRYEYNVRYYFGEEYYENALKENFENLMSYLNV
jgi:hypothetical protein